MKLPLLRLILPVVGLALFLAGLGFAVKNSELITLRFYLGQAWQMPLVVALFGAFVAGALMGVLASLSYVLRQRRIILGLRRELRNRPAADDEAH